MLRTNAAFSSSLKSALADLEERLQQKQNASPLFPASDDFLKTELKETEKVLNSNPFDMIELHSRIIERIFQGARNMEIALELQISEDLVSKVRNSDAGKYKLAAMNAEKQIHLIQVEAEIEALSKQAIVELGTMLRDEEIDAKTKTNIAQDLLDRAGFGAVKKSANVSAVFSAKDLNEIKKASVNLYNDKRETDEQVH